MLKTTLGILIGVTSYSSAFAGVIWRVEDGGNGHMYELTWTSQPNLISWTDANSAAEASYFNGTRGHLATITSAAENAFLRDSFLSQWQSPGDSAWIGLTDTLSEGTFAWTTGEVFGYSNWAPGEPSGGALENYVAYWLPIGPSGVREFLWNDFRDNWNTGDSGQRVGYFTEYDLPEVPEPATCVSWLLLSVFSFLRRERRQATRFNDG